MRWQTIGSVCGVTVLLVAHTVTEEDTDGTLVETIRIISARRATTRERERERESAMKKRANYTFDTLPPLTEAQRKHLDELTQMSDDQINTSDISALTDAQLAEMKRAEHYRPIKQQITARLDADVLAWLKAGGKGYQSRMNAILRQAMLSTKG